MTKRLYKSNTNKVISGVCGGFAEYFNIDATLVRLALVLFTFLGGSGIVIYIVAAIVMPSDNYIGHHGYTAPPPPPAHPHQPTYNSDYDPHQGNGNGPR